MLLIILFLNSRLPSTPRFWSSFATDAYTLWARPNFAYGYTRTIIQFKSNKLSNYKTGSPIVKSSKEKIEEFDEAKKKVAYSVIDGDMLQYYKSFKATLEVIPEGEGSIVKWLCEFEKASDEVPNPELIRDFAAKNFKEIDEYLLKA